MVAVCDEHLKRIPRGHTANIVDKKGCELCKMTEQEIKDYIKFRKEYMW